VNVNTADEEEIAECLLIDEKVAESIVEIREEIGGYTNVLELLYADGMSEKLLNSLREYIEI
jgi:competence protein ComEA